MAYFLRFTAFGAGETTSLRIYRRDVDINDREIDEQADPYDDETNSATVSLYLIFLKDIRVELIAILKYQAVIAYWRHFTVLDLGNVRNKLQHSKTRMDVCSSNSQFKVRFQNHHGRKGNKWWLCY